MLDSKIKIHPYPKIPLLPEEREVIVSQGEEKLPGTPKSAEASLLLDREINKVLRFDGKNSQDIKNFCRSLLEDWVNNPDNMVGFFSRAYEQSQNSQDFATRVKTLETCLTQNLADLLKRVESPKANAIGKFMKLAVTNPIYGDRARAILRGFFENAHTPAQFIDLLYEFGIAFMKESDRQMSDELCKILLWDSDICPRSRERAMRYLLALYMQGGEVVFKKWTEIDAVIAMFCKKQLPESSQLFIEQINDIGDDRELMDVGLKFCRDNPDKKDGYITYRSLTIEAEKKSGLVKVSGETLGNVWPFTLFSNPGPLKVLYNKRLEQENPNIVRIRVPNSQTGESLLKVKSQNEINRYIIENLASARELTLIGRADVEFLFYLRPEITSDKLDELALTNSNIKQKIVVSKIYGISPRGDRVLVTADEAKELKYHNVCYELSPSNVEVPIKCTVLVDRTQVVFGINKNYDVVEFPTGAELEVEVKKRAFLDYFILSHLYELQCSERIQHGLGRQGVSRESEFRDRRAHLRRLPQGQKPSADAIGRANQDPNRFNLIEINRMNDIAGNSSQTYVSPVHKPAPGDQPLLSYAPNAFDTFRSIITK